MHMEIYRTPIKNIYFVCLPYNYQHDEKYNHINI